MLMIEIVNDWPQTCSRRCGPARETSQCQRSPSGLETEAEDFMKNNNEEDEDIVE